jgi:hypothetical protein
MARIFGQSTQPSWTWCSVQQPGITGKVPRMIILSISIERRLRSSCPASHATCSNKPCLQPCPVVAAVSDAQCCRFASRQGRGFETALIVSSLAGRLGCTGNWLTAPCFLSVACLCSRSSPRPSQVGLTILCLV